MTSIIYNFDDAQQMRQHLDDLAKGHNVSDVDERIRMKLKHGEMSDDMRVFLNDLRAALNEM